MPFTAGDHIAGSHNPGEKPTHITRDFIHYFFIVCPAGKIHPFKRGISIFSERTGTPILFTYIEGNSTLWPKGQFFAKPGKLIVHVGPVHQPAPIDVVYKAYKEWVLKINPDAFADEEIEDTNHSSEKGKDNGHC